ncbi:19897_t:CDS:2, partial [Dentiscutata erythropus]
MALLHGTRSGNPWAIELSGFGEKKKKELEGKKEILMWYTTSGQMIKRVSFVNTKSEASFGSLCETNSCFS